MGLVEKAQKILEAAVPYAITVSLFVLLPPAAFFNFVFSTIRSRNAVEEDLSRKVVLITGASSGIGEHVAYEYARRGALLALVARRKQRLREVAEKAQKLGSPGVLVVRGDVSKIDDCRRYIDKTIDRFGRLDHLVNNAGIAPVCMFQDSEISDLALVMETNFWGSVHTTHFAIPHLQKNKGKIIVIASITGWFPMPRLSLYNASKAALISLYETLRVEAGEDVGITIVTPGLVESEITNSEFLSKLGLLEDHLKLLPVESVGECARSIVLAACHGERSLALTWRVRAGFLWKVFCPEFVEFISHWQFMWRPQTSNDRVASRKSLSSHAITEQLLKPLTTGPPKAI